MPWPMSQDYNEAIQSPATSFSDPELKVGQVVCNAMGLPVPCSGNFADVYALQTAQRKWAIKCFTREIPGIRERYVEVSKYLAQQNLPFMVEFKFLDQGIRVRGQWYPVLKMHWVEGFALNQFVRQQAGNPAVLQTLGQMWVKMAVLLRQSHLAHCDLQHGNVLMVPGAKAGMLSLRLVDYDGMCVPALELLKSIEVGHPNYQHPQRLKEGTYNIDVDRFAHLVIATALRALTVGGAGLWQKFDNGDNLLFKQADLANPSQSAVFRELQGIKDGETRKLVDALAQAAVKPINQVPLLESLVTIPKTVVTAGAPSQPTTNVFADATAGDSRPRAKAKSLGLVWAGLAVVLLAAVGGVVALMVSQKGENKLPTEVAAATTRKTPSETTAKLPTPPETKAVVPPTLPKVETKAGPKIEPPKPEPVPMPDPKETKKDPPPPDVKTPVKWVEGTAPLVRTAEVGNRPIRHLVVSGDGTRAVSYGPPGGICIWNMEDGTMKRGDTPNNLAIQSAAFLTKKYVLLQYDGRVDVVDIDTLGSKEFDSVRGDAKAVAAPANGRWCLVLGKTARQLEMPAVQLMATSNVQDPPITRCALTPDGVHALMLGGETVNYWNLSKGLQPKPVAATQRGVTDVEISPNGQTALLLTSNDAVAWNLTTDKFIGLISGRLPITSVTFTADSNHAILGLQSGDIRIIGLKSPAVIATLKGHTQAVRTVKVMPDRKTLWSTGDDQTMRCWTLPESVTQPGAVVAKLPDLPAAKPPAASEWVILKPKTVTFSMGATFTPLADQSLLVTGGKDRDTYTVTVETDLQSITAIRLEVLTDERLQDKGPGRGKYGNFRLSDFEVTAAPKGKPTQAKKVALQNARASFSQTGCEIQAAIDGQAKGLKDNGWGIHPNEARDQWATFETKEAIGFPDGTILTFTLDQQYGYDHTIGRFRISLKGEMPTKDPPPVTKIDPKDVPAAKPPAASEWVILKPKTVTSSMGATFTPLVDQSLLVTGGKDRDSYTFTAETDLQHITAVRLDVLADNRMPGKGPGRSPNGNFVLTEFTANAGPKSDATAGKKVILENPQASYSQPGFNIKSAIDGVPETTGWGVNTRTGEDHWALFDFKEEVGFEGGTVLRFTLYHRYGEEHLIGRFRISVKGVKAKTEIVPPIPIPIAERLQVPDAAAQATADKTIKGVFAADYAKRFAADRRALALKLFQQGQATKDDAAARFVCYRETRDVAAGVPDPELVMQAVDAMSAEFVVDALALKEDALVLAARAPSTPASNKALYEAASSLIDKALDRDEYDRAISLAKIAQSGAFRGKLPEQTAAAVRVRDVEELKRDFTAVQAARKILAANPNDPAANLLVGKYHFSRGDAEQALPMLAKSSDAKLKELAAKDLAGAKDAKEQLALGDSWYDYGLAAADAMKKPLQRRAAHWYQQVLPDLMGLDQAKVEQRLKIMGAIPKDPDALTILFARYGAYDTWHDVTAEMQKLVTQAKATVRPENVYNGDPAFGKHKALIVVYQFRGKSFLAIRGNDTAGPLSIPDGQGSIVHKEINTEQAGQQFMLVTAHFGADTGWADVTTRLPQFFRGGQVTVTPEKDLINPDPAPGKAKTLLVLYKHLGKLSLSVTGSTNTAIIPMR